MYCRFCGVQIDDEVVVCPKCGKQVKALKYEQSYHKSSQNINTGSISFDGFGDSSQKKNKLTAIILCCIGFAGAGGLHKFYEGNIGMGILYILTGGLFFIGTIIDLVNLCSMPNEYRV